MRIAVLCALVATTLFTANSAEARNRRRCCYTARTYNSCGSCGQTAWNNYAPAAPCQGGACGVATPVQAACAPAQPATYTSAYPPSADPNAAVAPQPVQQQVIQPGAGTTNGQFQSPPPPQPINN